MKEATREQGAWIRRVLDLSTRYLPRELWDSAEHDFAGVSSRWNTIVYPLEYGCLLWVPDDPQESSNDQEEATLPEVLKVQLYARSLGCDYVLLDADGELVPEGALDDYAESGEGGPPYDAATRTGMYDHD